MLDSDLELIAQPVPKLEYLAQFTTYNDVPFTGMSFRVLAGITEEELTQFELFSPYAPSSGYSYTASRVEYRARRQAEAYDRIAQELVDQLEDWTPMVLKGYCPESVEIVRSIISGFKSGGNGVVSDTKKD
jgi:hypothetical protein